MWDKIEAIKKGKYQEVNISSLPAWWGKIGLQIENLIINNRQFILKSLSINPLDVIAEGPYFQRPSQRIKGCQIDYLIQTRLNSLFVCEIKFSQNELRKTVINEMEEKISRLSIPKRYAVLPVLIHCNLVSEEVQDAEYFYRIINFSEFLS
jgi:hypothetical protein